MNLICWGEAYLLRLRCLNAKGVDAAHQYGLDRERVSERVGLTRMIAPDANYMNSSARG